jgi:hypothetical protein
MEVVYAAGVHDLLPIYLWTPEAPHHHAAR